METKIPGKNRRSQQSEKNKSYNRDDELGVPGRRISQFGNEAHAVVFVPLERGFAQPFDSLATHCATLAARMLARLPDQHAQPRCRRLPTCTLRTPG